MKEKYKLESITLQNILRHTNLGIHVIDNNYNTVIYNENMAELEGMKRKNVLGENIFDMFPSLDEASSTLTKALKDKTMINNKIQTYRNVKGEEIVSTNTTVPLYDDGVVIGAMEISNNITHIKELSDTLINLQREIQDKNIEIENIKGFIEGYTFDDIIGEHEDFIKTKEMAKIASGTDASTLIYGETGTGKELFAQSIHYGGDRRHNPFIAQNCAAIPDTLLEGILFGTEKGSFTGAVEREGIFEQANGGTLLLDEINSMSIDLQAKLLRVIQENYIRRIGGKEDIPIDVRIIATTNQDPIESVENKVIRKDLFYRLNVISLSIPPLRERKSDIIILVDHFIEKHNKKLNRNIEGISPNMIEVFNEYNWPGNVRELENAIESSLNIASKKTKILEEKDFITTFLFENMKKKQNNEDKRSLDLKNMDLNQYIDEKEKEIIKEYLLKNDSNITKTASELGISRQSLQYKLKKFRL